MEQRVNNLAERLAHVEAQLASAKDDRQEMKEKLDETNKNLEALLREIERWKGKLGGVLFIIGCLWAFFSGALSALGNWVKIKGDF